MINRETRIRKISKRKKNRLKGRNKRETLKTGRKRDKKIPNFTSAKTIDKTMLISFNSRANSTTVGIDATPNFEIIPSPHALCNNSHKRSFFLFSINLKRDLRHTADHQLIGRPTMALQTPAHRGGASGKLKNKQ